MVHCRPCGPVAVLAYRSKPGLLDLPLTTSHDQPWPSGTQANSWWKLNALRA